MAELTIGIAGLGRWGRNYLATLTRIPGCRVVAVADPAIPKVDGLAVYRTGQEMLNHEPLDAMVIATPERTHYALARAALDSGRHVLVEKPMALDLAEAIHLSELAYRSGLVLEIGHTALYSLGFIRLHKAIQKGRLGSIRKMKAHRTSSGSSGIPAEASRSLNPLWDLAVHDLAMAILLLGQPLLGSARYNSNQDVSYTLTFAGGATLSGRASWQEGPVQRRFTAIGTLRQASCSDSSRGQRFATRPLTRQCLDFLHSCQTGSAPLSNCALGTLVTGCVGALQASARMDGRWTPVPLSA